MGEELNGRFDPRNIKVSFENGAFKVQMSDGTRRIYQASSPYLLLKEIFPNGKILRYRFNEAAELVIESMDPHERHVYASVRVKEKGLNILLKHPLAYCSLRLTIDVSIK